MSEAIGQVLPFGVGVALSPVPIVGVTLMLATPAARRNGIGFVCGWVLGLAAVGAVVLLISGAAGTGDRGQPATWVSLLKLALGALLLLTAARQWRQRPGPEGEAGMPAWMRKIESFGPLQAGGLAVLLAAVNPKNLLLAVAAAAAIAQSGLSAGGEATALVVFVLIATLGPGLPVAVYLAMGERSKLPLERLRGWMAGNNAAIMAVICLILAAKLIGDGVAGL